MAKYIDSTYMLGVDLGQRRDPSCISVIEVQRIRDIGQMNLRMLATLSYPRHMVLTRSLNKIYVLRDLKQFKLGTSYTDVSQEINKLVHDSAIQPKSVLEDDKGITKVMELPVGTPRLPELVLDQSGVGGPVMDYCREIGLTPMGIVITNGERPHQNSAPKKDIVSAFLLAYEQQRFKIARHLELLPQFVYQLQQFKGGLSDSGRATYEAAKGHDDLILAVCLPLWYSEVVEEHTPHFAPNRSFNIFAR